jgi:uncharacterized repeat protein (TIGR02543 family)
MTGGSVERCSIRFESGLTGSIQRIRRICKMERFFTQIARLGRTAAFFAAAVLVFALAACPNPSGDEQHTITFDSQGGSEVQPVTAATGTQVPKPADPAKAGHSFQGWHSAASGGTEYAWPHTLDADVTMYARWQENVQQYTITFDSQGGSEVQPVTADAGTEVPKPADPIKAGHAFQGWHSAASGGTEYAWPHTLDADVTMYARWQENAQQYTITFDSQDGSAVQPVTADAGTPVAKPADPMRAGHSFQGWFNAASGGILYAWPHNLTGNVTMYARWQDNTQPSPEQYTITLDSQGGSAVQPVTADEGTPVAKPADPTKADYSFQGWFNAASGGTEYAWPHTLDTDVTMYARWEALPPPSLTGTVSIGGTAQVGQTLTANTAALGGSGTISYQWERGDSATGPFVGIDGAGGETYGLVTADGGKYIQVTVSRTGNNGTVSSAVSGPVALPPLAGTITVTGTAQVGQTLTANTGALGGGGTISYQWERGDSAAGSFAAISGANALSYALAAADQGKYIRVTVSRVENSGTISSDAVGPVIAPQLTGAASITGSYNAGTGSSPLVLTAITTSLGGSGEIRHQWERADSATGTFTGIDGADGETYGLVAADQGKYIRVTVSRAENSGTISSDAVGPVALPTIAGTASIAGSHDAQGGSASLVLTADAAGLGGSGTIIYQWQRADSATGNFSDISGATNGTYRLVEPDQGKYIRVRATRVGYNSAIDSAAVGPVTLPILTGAVTITGDAKVRMVLTADTSALSGSETTFNYRWERSDSAGGAYTNIPGANAGTYTLAMADLDKYIRVTVSRTGYNGTQTSGSTAQVTLQPAGGRIITIGFNYGAIAITGDNGTNEIYKASAAPNSVTLSAADYEDVQWYVDGGVFPAGTGDSITLSASDYSAKSHSITFTGKKDGKLYSQVIPFTVKN